MDLIQFYSRWTWWIVSQISSVSFLVYTLLSVELWSIDSWGVFPKPWECYGRLGGVKYITVCIANDNFPEAAKFHKSIFSPHQMPPLLSAALRLPPAAVAAMLKKWIWRHNSVAIVRFGRNLVGKCRITRRWWRKRKNRNRK